MTPDDFEQTSYHGFLIVGSSQDGSVITLDLEYYDDDDDEDMQAYARAVISGAGAISRDGARLERFEMEAEYADVLSVERKETEIVMIVEWKNFSPLSQFYVMYKFKGPNVQIKGQRVYKGSTA